MRALIVEDNREISECMDECLRDMDIVSDCFHDGRNVSEAFRTVGYDILILDLNLPDADGLSILRDIRARGVNTPVLIVSARARIDERVSGLDLGADDYLVKPFDLDEFEARVRALLRRHQDTKSPVFHLGELAFDQVTREVTVNDQPIDLAPRERAVLEVLIRQSGTVLSKEKIAEHVFNFDDEAGITSIELYVHRLRKKLAASSVQIVTQRGLGYALQLAE